MKDPLVDIFRAHWDQQRDVAPNALLGPHVAHIEAVLAFLDAEPDAAKIQKEIRRIFETTNWLLVPEHVQEFIQAVGEAQFWALARAKGVPLERIPEQAYPTPDFRLANGEAQAPCFEVKTLSVAEGVNNLRRMDESSYEAQLDLSEQISQGERVATTIHEAAPHGAITDGRYQTAISRNLIDKATNNVKRGQYQEAPTCLVLNLLLIDAHFNGSSSLRPVAPGYPEAWNVRSGAFWNLAFGRPDDRVFGIPEFEGKPSVEGILERQGVLEAYPEIRALLLIVHSWNGAPKIYGLKRESEVDDWNEDLRPVAKAFFALVDAWNDEDDTNAYALLDH